MKFTVALALLSVAHAWPLFGRTGNYEDRPSDTSISGKQASCPAGAVRIRSEQSGLCLSPQVDDKSGNEKHRRNNDGSSRDSSYGASKDDGKQYREGVKVVTADCKDAAAWFLPDHDDKKGGDRVIDAKDVSGPIVLADHPELALDAGRKPADGGPLSLYKLNSSPQQDFTFKDGQLQANNSQCIDIGRSSELQTWTCDKENANNNQRFEIVECKVQQETQPAQPTTAHKTKTETKVQEKPTTVYKTKTDLKTEVKTQTQYKTETKVVPTTVVKTETKTETKVEQQAPVTVTPAPVTQTKYETRYKTETRTKNNTLTETKTQTKTEQQAPVTVTLAPIMQTRTETEYVTKTNDVTSIKPITETNNVTSTKPVTQTRVVTSTKPVTETKVATKVETTTVEKPITKIEQVKEYRTETKYETKTVTEEAKPKETGQAEQGQGQHQDKEYGQHGQQGQDHGKDHGQHGQQGQDHGKDHEQHGQHEHGKEQGKGENQH